jgi:hypothetical protein
MIVSSQITIILILVNMHDYLPGPPMKIIRMAINQITMVTVRMVFISIRIIFYFYHIDHV